MSAQHESTARTVLANTGWLLADKVCRLTISVLVGAWVARHLGPIAFGELAYVLALLALLQAACTLGFDGPVVRDIAQESQRTANLLGSAMGLRLAAGIAGWIVAMLVVRALRPEDTAALVMIALAGAALVFQPAEVVDLWFQSCSRSKATVGYRLAAYLAVALFKVALILQDAPLWAFAGTAAFDALLVAAALTLAYSRSPATARWHFDRVIARRLLAESWPFMLAALSVGIYMRIDQMMLRDLSDERQLGLYSAVIPFSQAWHMLPMTLCASLLPRLSQLRQESPQRYRLRLQQTFSLMTWGGAAAAGLTAVCAPWLVRWLLDARFADAIPVLQWHAITNVFVFMGVAQSLAIVNERTPHVALIKTLIGAAVSVAMNLLLIPRWGAVGAAWAAIVAYGASAVLVNAIVAPEAFRMQLRSLFPFGHVAR
jgi:O-antigen/teichoic acid export membrane protein